MIASVGLWFYFSNINEVPTSNTRSKATYNTDMLFVSSSTRAAFFACVALERVKGAERVERALKRESFPVLILAFKLHDLAEVLVEIAEFSTIFPDNHAQNGKLG